MGKISIKTQERNTKALRILNTYIQARTGTSSKMHFFTQVSSRNSERHLCKYFAKVENLKKHAKGIDGKPEYIRQKW